MTSRLASSLLGRGVAALAVVLVSVAAQAWPEAPRRRMPWEPPELRPLPLRLDEAPELPLLAPFRDPRGAPVTDFATYRSGPWGQWRRRLWYPLAPETPDDAPASAALGLPHLERSAGEDDPWLVHLRARPAAFPLRSEGNDAHWFVRHDEEQASGLRHARTTSVAALPADPLAIEERWVPPWLQRLDPDLASELLGTTGCGRGGACSPSAPFPGEAFLELWNALAPVARPIPEWQCRERPTIIGRYGGEQASFVLLRCDGSLADGALERLSVLARPPSVPAPEDLPAEPDPRAAPGEWVPGVRLLDPRLVWVLAKIADHFPRRAIYLYSGYRPGRGEIPEGHGSLHAHGRAIDLAVKGISNEELLAWCHELPDTGCGYYPKSRFVHVDVRPRSSGSTVWVDASSPGEPSRYVTDWPGVVEEGRVVWQPSAADVSSTD